MEAFSCLHTAGVTGSIPVPPTIRVKDLRRLLVVFIDEWGLSEQPTRVRTWAPKGCTPIVHFHSNLKLVSAVAGLTRSNFLFQLYDGAVRSAQIVEPRLSTVAPRWMRARSPLNHALAHIEEGEQQTPVERGSSVARRKFSSGCCRSAAKSRSGSLQRSDLGPLNA